MKTSSSQRAVRWGAWLLLLILPGISAHARARHGETWARDHFAAAERMRDALNGRLPADRNRHDYQRVINAYRAVYFGAPASSKADPSVVAVAETLVEMGRRFDDKKILTGAIAQYKFLRREYPGSKYRFDALFTIGEVYKDDLGDPDAARSAFEEFLRRYPNNRLAEDAQQAIVALDRQAQSEKRRRRKKIPGRRRPPRIPDPTNSPRPRSQCNLVRLPGRLLESPASGTGRRPTIPASPLTWRVTSSSHRSVSPIPTESSSIFAAPGWPRPWWARVST